MDHSYVSRQHPPVDQESSSTIPRSPVSRRTGRSRSVSESGHGPVSSPDGSLRLSALATPGRISSSSQHDSQTRSERPRKSRYSSGKGQSSGRSVREGRLPHAEGGQGRLHIYKPGSLGSEEEDGIPPEPKKSKVNPLPDIMHDWEIIVKSLKANERREKLEVTKASSSASEKKLWCVRLFSL